MSSKLNNLSHRRTHNLLLISKLLNQHQHASPLTLVLDSVEQSGRPLVREYLRRARQGPKIQTIFLSFETVPPSSSSSSSSNTYTNAHTHTHTYTNTHTTTSPSTTTTTNKDKDKDGNGGGDGDDHGWIDDFIPCHDKSPEQILQACRDARTRAARTRKGTTTTTTTTTSSERCLIVIDSLSVFVGLSLSGSGAGPPRSGAGAGSGFNLPGFLSMLLQISPSPPTPSPSAPPPPPAGSVSIVAVYHTDVHQHLDTTSGLNPSYYYYPSPLSLLKYLATTIISVHSPAILLAEKAAQERSLAAPAFGLAQEVEGIVVGLKPAPAPAAVSGPRPGPGPGSVGTEGIVLELEHRRKSGRGVHELYFLPSSLSPQPSPSTSSSVSPSKESIILLDDHPLFAAKPQALTDDEQGKAEEGLTTFELGLTERQRLERDGVVLPYFDAQKSGVGGGGGGGAGGGSGGRILYDMGEEDDFDEEEDEI